MTRRTLLSGLALLLSGCAGVSTGVFEKARAPACEYGGEPGTPMIVLAAQAVPSATLLPCVKPLPAGWNVSDVFIQSGKARFTLSSDRVGRNAVTVVLQRYCSLPPVTRVPTDEPGTRRLEQVGPLLPGAGYTGARYYLFDGGCVSYRFQFQPGESAAPLGELTNTLSFVSRHDVDRRVRHDTGGRADLDQGAG